MLTVEHFSHGVIDPVFAFAMGFLGSGLALGCAARARTTGAAHRNRWLALAAMSLGSGIWLTHFTAMLGFDVPSTPVRYSTGLTAVSAALAVIVVFLGLFAVGTGRPTPLKVMLGGVFTGAGISAMHYTGMAAIRVAGSVTYNARLVIASVLIAIVASMVALWLATVVRGRGQVLVAGGVMALAVCAMHYTGMAAVGVQLDARYGAVEGVTPITLGLPIVLLVATVLVVMLLVALQTASSEDRIVPPNPSNERTPRHQGWTGGPGRTHTR